jgi:organic hydroperoxide reductase OsmC/OhrA
MSDPAAVAPDEAFVASLSSCHMLWSLVIAAGRGFVVDEHRDEAVGVLARDSAGRMAMTTVTLRPIISFAGEPRPSDVEIDAMHHKAHEACFIASSVKTDVRVER